MCLAPLSASLDKSAIIWPKSTKSSSSLVSAAYCCLQSSYCSLVNNDDHGFPPALLQPQLFSRNLARILLVNSEAIGGTRDTRGDLPHCFRQSRDSSVHSLSHSGLGTLAAGAWRGL